MTLDGKTIVVTGATTGIGAETAAELQRQGARVIGVDRTLTEACDAFHLLDLAEAEAVDFLVDELPEGLDGLCNLAEVPPTAPAEEVIRIQLLAMRRLTEGLAPTLADGAAVTALSSVAGNGWRRAVDEVLHVLALDADDDVTDFCARHRLDEGGRGHVLGMQSVQVYTSRRRWAWWDRGIRINAVSPGPIDVPGLPDVAPPAGLGPERAVGPRRSARPTDIAPVVAFLHGDGAAWLTGANLPVDGGLSSHLLAQEHDLDP